MKSWLPSLVLVVIASQYVASSVTIATASLPNGTVNTAYSAVIRVSGGCTPYKWAIVSGALPAGLTAKASSSTTTLNLSGSPTKAGTYSFAVKVTGCGGAASQVTYKVAIQAAAEHVVDLDWDASSSSDVVGYNVYRSPDDTAWKRINASMVASTLYSDLTVASGTTYYYAVTAVDGSGVESGKTAAIKVVVP